MTRYTVLLGLLVAMIAVYGDNEGICWGVNESWNICGTLCAPTCQDQKPDPRWCPRIACSNYTAGCRCDEGYVRNTTDRTCVLPADCQKN